jgi:hypothetical protein
MIYVTLRYLKGQYRSAFFSVTCIFFCEQFVCANTKYVLYESPANFIEGFSRFQTFFFDFPTKIAVFLRFIPRFLSGSGIRQS